MFKTMVQINRKCRLSRLCSSCSKRCCEKNSDLELLFAEGNGAAMTANKHQKIRAALCWNKELAKLTKQHNNANILSIP